MIEFDELDEIPPALSDDVLQDWEAARAYYGLDDSFLYTDEAILEYVAVFRKAFTCKNI